jgi:hypothetical protein
MSNSKGSVGIGLLLGWGLNLCQLFVGVMLVTYLMTKEDFIPVAATVVIGGIGLIQLVYILPLYFRFKRQGQTATATGLVVAASFTALLSCACWSVQLSRNVR